MISVIFVNKNENGENKKITNSLRKTYTKMKKMMKTKTKLKRENRKRFKTKMKKIENENENAKTAKLVTQQKC